MKVWTIFKLVSSPLFGAVQVFKYPNYHQMHADVVQEPHCFCHLFVHCWNPASKVLHIAAMEQLQTGEEEEVWRRSIQSEAVRLSKLYLVDDALNHKRIFQNMLTNPSVEQDTCQTRDKWKLIFVCFVLFSLVVLCFEGPCPTPSAMCISCKIKQSNIACWHSNFASKFLVFCMCYQ